MIAALRSFWLLSDLTIDRNVSFIINHSHSDKLIIQFLYLNSFTFYKLNCLFLSFFWFFRRCNFSPNFIQLFTFYYLIFLLLYFFNHFLIIWWELKLLFNYFVNRIYLILHKFSYVLFQIWQDFFITVNGSLHLFRYLTLWD